jgi:hypothetical protein
VRFYLKFIPILALIFLIFLLTARAIGTTRPPNPALRGFVEGCEDKPQPCWYGIVPGVTTVEEALHTMEVMGYPRSLADQREFDIIYRHVGENNIMVDFYNYPVLELDHNIAKAIYFRDLGDMRLSDVLDFFGTPTRVILFNHDYFMVDPYVSFELVGHYAASLSQPIWNLNISSLRPPDSNAGIPWRGFAFEWFYEHQRNY